MRAASAEVARADCAFVISCEHAGNDVPEPYSNLFRSPEARAALGSHRGWDPGSAEIGVQLARELGAPLTAQMASRLLVDCNRSLGHPALFSEFSRGLPKAEKAILLEQYWGRHRGEVRRHIDTAPAGVLVVHVGVHTFTPVWKGRERPTHIGLLYDPRREIEAGVARRWRRALERVLRPGVLGDVAVDGAADPSAPRGGVAGRSTAAKMATVTGKARAAGGATATRMAALRVHLNRPYRGWSDGLTTMLRTELDATRYVGIEVEVSQALEPLPTHVVSGIATTLRMVVEDA